MPQCDWCQADGEVIATDTDKGRAMLCCHCNREYRIYRAFIEGVERNRKGGKRNGVAKDIG